ncbi:MAG: DUF393 domain-containing protein [Flavobacteriales bacterium]|nr:DUF393 domain-containing protein [Flavobacteriales bacterium]
MSDPTHLVLYDGDCAYCNGWVNWIRTRDKAARFRYIALGSAEGLALRDRYAVPADVDSVVLVLGDHAYVKSEAAWRILSALPGHRLASTALRLIPRPLRDLGYDLVARNRHRLGMQDSCELPDR